MINELIFVTFTLKDPHKVYICNLDIHFVGLLGSDISEHYNYVIDVNNKELISNFKTLLLNCEKINEESPTCSSVNKISIELTEIICKFKCELKEMEAIMLTTQFERVHIPNVILKINRKYEFFTSILNANVIPKIIMFSEITNGAIFR